MADFEIAELVHKFVRTHIFSKRVLLCCAPIYNRVFASFSSANYQDEKKSRHVVTGSSLAFMALFF